MSTEGSEYRGLVVMKTEKRLSVQRELESEWYTTETVLVESGSLIA